MKKRIFVGSSSESSSLVTQLCATLEARYGDEIEFVSWTIAFDFSAEIISSLLEIFRTYDGAVFVVTGADERIPGMLPSLDSHGCCHSCLCCPCKCGNRPSHDHRRDEPDETTAYARRPRDNVFFEMGLAFQILGSKNVVLVRTARVPIGSDFKSLAHQTLPDDPSSHEVNECANRLYRHFIKRDGDASADLGRRAYERLALVRELTSRVLTPLKVLTSQQCKDENDDTPRWKYDRIRVYQFDRESEAFDGLVEVGGVADNFRRVRIPLCTDVLSQVLVKQSACLLHRLVGDREFVEVWSGAPSSTKRHLTDFDRRLEPHDLPALERTALSEWLDVPLIHTTPAGETVLIGKMTIDNAYSGKPLDPCDVELWSFAKSAAALIYKSRMGHGLSDVWGLGEDETRKVFRQAFRLEMLDDQLRTILAAAKRETGFSRFRLYLTIDEHLRLFVSAQ